MKITNKQALPDALVKAVMLDPYKQTGHISVTQLISPPQITTLLGRHGENLEEDAASRIWALAGQGVHAVLARAAQVDHKQVNFSELVDTIKNAIRGSNLDIALDVAAEGAARAVLKLFESKVVSEDRMDVEIEGWVLSGQLDLYEPEKERLSDWKFVGTFSYKMASTEGKSEWEEQVNIYRWLLYKKKNILAKELEIVCILRDFMESKAGTAGYPGSAVQRLMVPVWDINITEEFIRERIKLHQNAAKLPDDQLPSCSDEERWFRKGKNARCEKYCTVSSVCHQFKSLGSKI